jgi:hypothetical protein
MKKFHILCSLFLNLSSVINIYAAWATRDVMILIDCLTPGHQSSELNSPPGAIGCDLSFAIGQEAAQ